MAGKKKVSTKKYLLAKGTPAAGIEKGVYYNYYKDDAALLDAIVAKGSKAFTLNPNYMEPSADENKNESQTTE